MPTCDICPRQCSIPDKVTGDCLVRGATGNRVRLLNYGMASTLSVGPIEKKLYHFLPGKKVLSIGSFGCNLHCAYCQNSSVSQTSGPGTYLSAAQLTRIALSKQVPAIAFTYSEPLVWYEYVINAARLARKAGLATILKTNAYAHPTRFLRMCQFMDAVDVDIKGTFWSYCMICGIGQEDPWPVIDNLAVASKMCHTEISYPLYRNNITQGILEVIRRRSGDIPFKIPKIVPNGPSWAELALAEKEARQYFSYVYLDAPTCKGVTACVHCNEILVSRTGLNVHIMYNELGKCPGCQAEVPIVHEI